MGKVKWDLKSKIVERFGCQADFAAVLGCDEAVVSRVIRGRRKLNDAAKKVWAKRLGAKVLEIFPEG